MIAKLERKLMASQKVSDLEAEVGQRLLLNDDEDRDGVAINNPTLTALD